jgi:hypothetical protein
MAVWKPIGILFQTHWLDSLKKKSNCTITTITRARPLTANTWQAASGFVIAVATATSALSGLLHSQLTGKEPPVALNGRI